MKWFRKFFLHTFLIISSSVMIMPFVWMLLTSFKTPAESINIPLKWFPQKKWFIKGTDTEIIKKDQNLWEIKTGPDRGKRITLLQSQIVSKTFMWQNYKKAWQSAPFGIYFFNSIFTSFIITLTQIFTSSLAAYAFSRFNFVFKKQLFMMLLGTLMIPGQVLLIPNYIILSKLGLIDTYGALVIPWLASVFGIYFMKQHFDTIPKDLFDAAKIDGCKDTQILFHIVFPLSVSVIASTGLLTFISNWNSLLWPLIVTNSVNMRTLQVGLAVFNQEAGTMWPLLMAASTFSLLPLVVLFFLTQKTFIEGIAGSGLKE